MEENEHYVAMKMAHEDIYKLEKCVWNLRAMFTCFDKQLAVDYPGFQKDSQAEINDAIEIINNFHERTKDNSSYGMAPFPARGMTASTYRRKNATS